MPDANTLRELWLAEEAASFQGWDFSRLDGRMTEEPLPWDYRELLGRYLRPEHKLLDMGTGGGEFLLSLGHPAPNTCVTEAYPPNIRLCQERLAPLGITVRAIVDDDVIPYDDAAFDVVLNRHESFDAREVYRVLKPGGVFITQQVGGQNNRGLSARLLGDLPALENPHDLASNLSRLRDAGFDLPHSGEAFPLARFSDVGAVVYFAKIIEWEFPGFSVERRFDALLRLQGELEERGFVESRGHRFYAVGIRA